MGGMDAEGWERVLTSTAGLIGIALGALIAWLTGRSDAGVQIEGQRAIAWDAPLREQRRQEVQPLLDEARRRYYALRDLNEQWDAYATLHRSGRTV